VATQGTPKRTLQVTPPPSPTRATNFHVSSRPKLLQQSTQPPLRENSIGSNVGMMARNSLSHSPQVSVIERTKPPAVTMTGAMRIPRSTIPVAQVENRKSTSHRLVMNVSDRPKASELATVKGYTRSRPEGVSTSGITERVSSRPTSVSFPSKRSGGMQPENSESGGRSRLTRGIGDHSVLTVSDV